MLAHSLFKKQIYSNGSSQKEQKGKMAAVYEKILNWTLNHKLITSAYFNRTSRRKFVFSSGYRCQFPSR